MTFEDEAIAEAKRIWAGLSSAGKMELTKALSWAARHLWWVLPVTFLLGLLLGTLLTL
ncbi:MAG: hypothetical protein J0H79_13890 [Alphaproteobacteria bacterium]|nr:hypothetical protein [Alphaproteobacteria bacterium]